MDSGPLIFSPLGPTYWNPLANIITQPATGHFYAANGAVINRINDRLLVGASATDQDGETGNLHRSWLGQTAGGVNRYMDTTSVFEVLTVLGSNVAAAFGARSQDYSSSDGVFAITAHASNDRVGGEPNAWGIYSSAVRVSSDAKYTAGYEVDVTTLQPKVRASAYNVVPYGVTIGYSVAAGGESALRSAGADSGLTVYPSSVGIAFFTAGTGVNQADPVAGTGAVWDKGIVFQSNSIIGTDGSLGAWGIAIEMAKGHSVVWANDVGDTDIGGMIRSDNSSGQSDYQQRVVFGATRLQIKGVDTDLVTEKIVFENAVKTIGGGAITSHIVSTPGSASNPPAFFADGAATNIDIQLAVKGTGTVWLGTGVATPTTPASFVANKALRVKDGTGATYYIPVMAALW